MYFIPCVRVDLPLNAPEREAVRVAAAFEPLLQALERPAPTYVSVALSGAAIAVLARHGQERLLVRLGQSSARGRVALLTTPAHGALLPLLPRSEIERQIALTDEAAEACFGDAYHPTVLWPTALAVDRKVCEVAVARGLSAVLVDEAAMRVWPGEWEGDRVDQVARLPGLYLLPSSRAASHTFAGGAHAGRDLAPLRDTLLKDEALLSQMRYLVATIDLSEHEALHPSFLSALERMRTMHPHDLATRFSGALATDPLPSSERSTADELAEGLPFATWFSPQNPWQGPMWRLTTRLYDVLRTLEQKGLTAVPAVGELRRQLDVGWREKPWRDASSETADTAALRHETDRRWRPVLDALKPWLPADLHAELERETDAIGRPAV